MALFSCPLTHGSAHAQSRILTFLNRAAPLPERMASIKACLASTGLLRGPELDLDAVRDAVGARVTGGDGGDGGGRAGGDWIPKSSGPGGSAPCADSTASRRLWSSSEAEDVT